MAAAQRELDAPWNVWLLAQAREDLGVPVVDLAGDPLKRCAGARHRGEVAPAERVVSEAGAIATPVR